VHLLQASDGGAYVFTRTGSSWNNGQSVSDQKLVAANRADAHFVYSVSLEDDTIAVGAPIKSANEGAVCTFTRSSENWTRAAELVHTNISAVSPAPLSCYSRALCADDSSAEKLPTHPPTVCDLFSWHRQALLRLTFMRIS